MAVEILLTFISAVLILMSTPGPSQLLMLSNSISNGFRRSVFTAAGDLTANLIQMAVASLGLVSIIRNSAEFFLVIKWAGVAYLVFLGARLLFSSGSNEPMSSSKSTRSLSSLYWQGFMTSAANPKAVIFFAALFPQFINPDDPLLVQFVVLSTTYLTIDAIFLSFYGKSAEWIAQKLAQSGNQMMNRMAGTFLIIAAILLGLKDIEAK